MSPEDNEDLRARGYETPDTDDKGKVPPVEVAEKDQQVVVEQDRLSELLTKDQILAKEKERMARVAEILAKHDAAKNAMSLKAGPSKERERDDQVARLEMRMQNLLQVLMQKHPETYNTLISDDTKESDEDSSPLQTPTRVTKPIVETTTAPGVHAGISNLAGPIPTDSAWRRGIYNTRETQGEQTHLDTILANRAEQPGPDEPDDDGSDDGSERSNANDKRGPAMRPPRALFDNAMAQIRKVSSGRKLPNVPTPAKYSGTSDQPEHLRAWKYAAQAYLLGNALNPDSCLAFTHILNLTEKRANDFMAKRIVPEVMREFDVKAGGTNPSPITFDELIETFEKKFVDPEYKRRAISELESLRQRDNRGNYVRVRDIADKIEDLCESTNEQSEWQMKRYFIDAVDYKIAAAINRVMTWERDSVLLDHLVTVAAREEQSLLAERGARMAFQQGKKFSNYTALIAKPGKYAANNEQSIRPYQQQWRASDKGDHSPRDYQKQGHSNEQRPRDSSTPANGSTRNPTRDMSKITCHNCKKTGHYARNCRNRVESKLMAMNNNDAEIKVMSSSNYVGDDVQPANEAPIAPFTKYVSVPVKLEDQSGFNATIDTGASHTFIHPSLPKRLKVKMVRYPTPRNLKLGTKGSRSKIVGFCYLNWTIADLTTCQRFEIANIDDDVLVGRDFLRKHDAVVELNPDKIIIRNVMGRNIRHSKAEAVVPEHLQPLEAMPLNSETEMREIGREKFDPEYVPTQAEIDEFQAYLFEEYDDVFVDDKAPLSLPPLREVQHTIPYINPERADKKQRISYRFPDECMSAFNRCYKKHVEAGIWVPCAAERADPMIPSLKKDGEFRPLVDLRKRNLNTIQQDMPMQDADRMINEVANAQFASTFDLKGAFQQIRINPDDESKTPFMTPYGACYTRVAQQGDRNSTVSLARLIEHVFRDQLGRTMYAYADDTKIVSPSWGQHIRDTIEIAETARKHDLRFSKEKSLIAPVARDTLGRKIRKGVISIESDKRNAILALPVPTNKKELQSFLGMVEYNARFIPMLVDDTAPLATLTGNVPWRWGGACNAAFEAIKQKLAREVELTTINAQDLAPYSSSPAHLTQPPQQDNVPKNTVDGKYLFLQTDASVEGVGSALLIGENWWNAKPVGFHSRKFSPAEFNYTTPDQELQAFYEAFRHFEPRILGRKVIVLTDNSTLASLLTKNANLLTRKQVRIVVELARFNFEIKFIRGTYNVLADYLSRFPAENGTAPVFETNDDEFGDVLVESRQMTMRPQRTRQQTDRYAPPQAEKKSRQNGGEQKRTHPTERKAAPPKANAARNRFDKIARMRKDDAWAVPDSQDATLDIEHQSRLLESIARSYVLDPFFKKIITSREQFRNFVMEDDLLYLNDKGRMRLCVPFGHVQKRSMRELVLQHGHTVLGHAGAYRLVGWLQGKFYWPGMAVEAKKFGMTCPSCQACKPPHNTPMGLLHSLPVPDTPYENIHLDFQGPFPSARDVNGARVDYLLNAIDRLTGEVIMIPCNQTALTAEKTAKLFIAFVYPRWGIPQEITMDNDKVFRAAFWQNMWQLLGTTLSFSTSYHPQTNGKIERVHRDMNAAMRQLVAEEQTNWPQVVPFVEFAINSGRSSASGFSPFELSRFRTPQAMPSNLRYKGNTKNLASFVQETNLRVQQARDVIARTKVYQTITANKKRRADNEPQGTAGDKDVSPIGKYFWVSTKNLITAPFRARKWCPLFMGPYKCLTYNSNSSTYVLDIPTRLLSRRISPRFHASQLQQHRESDEALWPMRIVNTVPIFPIDSLEMSITKVISHITVVTDPQAPIHKFLVEDSATKSKWFIEETHDDFNEDLPAVQTYLRKRHVNKVRELPIVKARSASQRKAHKVRRAFREQVAMKATREKLQQLAELADYKASILRTTGELIDFTGLANQTGLGTLLHKGKRETRLIGGHHVVNQFKSVWSDDQSESGATDNFERMAIDQSVPRM
ncbi:BQ2448_3544 [Microbotryum intermedium]|uniref:RNA-directed DNA polymerase n=1 Tax=Microbotryum intermedium TaxID=269621 RepID=A0A238FAA7_9BASI|nr:BQ2448_3544 [Microbotryum intermedium]